MLGFFNKKKSLIESGLLKGATDNHSHILCGVDDGVRTFEESLSILNFLEEAGLKTLWLTPHIMEDVPNEPAALQERFARFKASYSGPIELKLAAEHMIDNLFEKRLGERNLLFHGDDFVLMETSTWMSPLDLWGTLEKTFSAGYRPIVAHPERYRYMSMKEYDRLKDMGCILQLNLPSIVGVYGETAREKAEQLLHKGYYSMVGSDCHRYKAITAQYNMKVLKSDTIEALRPLMAGEVRL